MDDEKEIASSADPKARLTLYWIRALAMRRNMWRLTREVEADAGLISDDWFGYEFTTVVGYWLASLFVVVEGFNKLGIKDPRVTKLLSPRLHDPKAMRHEMFHFQLEDEAKGVRALDAGKWAEELHDAIGEHLGEHVQDVLRSMGGSPGG